MDFNINIYVYIRKVKCTYIIYYITPLVRSGMALESSTLIFCHEIIRTIHVFELSVAK